MPKIHERLRMLIVCKIQDGANQRKVSRDLNICKTSERNIWNKFLNTGSVFDKSRSGGPAECSERERRLLCQYAKKQFMSAIKFNFQSICENSPQILT